jgi:hypothetical protein
MDGNWLPSYLLGRVADGSNSAREALQSQSPMKPQEFAALAALSLFAAAPATVLADASSTNPSVPVGSLTAFPTVVRTGTKPTLTWDITYPSVVVDYVTITPPATVTPKENLICDVRVLGAGVTTQNSNGSINYIRTKGFMRYNGSGSWSTIFDGRNTDTIVQQQGIIKTFEVTKGQAIHFGGQYYWNNAWSTFHNSTSGDQVRALVNGGTPPSNVPDYNAPSLESFIRPYLDANKKVKIGPMDVIVFMELTHTDKSNIGYDLQDLVFLITFRKP